MKITRDKNVVEFLPENQSETNDLSALWNIVVDCAKFNKKLVAMGEYVPSKSNLARFMIEGNVEENDAAYAREDQTVYCQTCNKYFFVKQGDQIPLCCGRTMEALD